MTPDQEQVERVLDKVDVAIMGCRPVIPNAAERQVELEIGKSIANPYHDSIKMICEGGCLREIWVGPRQQATLAEHGKDRFLIACMPCAVAQMAEMHKMTGEQIQVGTFSLGNIHPDD
jgi:hypothetical protein